MSEVRMCDVERDGNCYGIFSTKESGWQRVKSEVLETDDNGATTANTVMLDACPNCSVTPVRRPRMRALQSKAEDVVSVPHTCTTTTTIASCLACQVARRINDLRTVPDGKTQEM